MSSIDYDDGRPSCRVAGVPDKLPASYQQPSCGPWGVTLEEEMGRTMKMNTAFSQFAWESAKQDGCLPCPRTNLPQWPPTGKFLYPTMQKESEEVLGAHQYNPDISACPSGAPWRDNTSQVAGRRNGRNATSCAMLRANQALKNTDAACEDMFAHKRHIDEASTETTQGGSGGIALAEEIASQLLRGRVPIHSEPSGPMRQHERSRMQDKERIDELLTKNDNDVGRNVYSLETLLPCIGNTWTGIAYDLAHYDQLPGASEGENTFSYVFARDDRWKYVLSTAIIFLVVVILISAIASSIAGFRSSSQSQIKPKR